MFYYASKAFWFLFIPGNLLLLGALAGACLTGSRYARGGRWLAIICIVALFLIGKLPIGVWLIEPLEDRFPPPPNEIAAPTGIIILGGAIDDELSEARRTVTFEDGAARLTEAVVLARRFPHARIIYTGGSNVILPGHATEASLARELLIALGVDPMRIEIEERSRNTEENAQMTAAILRPQAGDSWLLVTSAYHMPRAMSLFRKAGFNAIAYPVDYHSPGPGHGWRLNREAARGRVLFDTAVREWIGLFAYRISGKTDAFLPTP